MAAARSFRELKVYVAARAAAQQIFAFSSHFPREERYALGEANETQSWLDDALDAAYLNRQQFAELDGQYQAIGGMLFRMIDRADDFCKHAPATDYRAVTARVEEESPFTDH